MPYKLAAPQAGMPALNDVSTTRKWPTGYEAAIVDSERTLPRGGTAIYALCGGANVVVGSLVELDPAAGVVLAPATGGVGGVAVSLNIVASGSYAWFQVEGAAAVKAPNAAVIGAEVFMLAATAGSVDDAAVAGEQILNAEFLTSTGTPSTGLAEIAINRPFHQGQIT